ncbi:unnamed protein product [Nippostrongylus brasiliensis]|uniref:Uncharacterized protein n=1 Tax=Nippostrongylus brasiliensis TaxID=27835 RepID=A0A0N4YEK3_NIPBR|nr:unnamed protein product [Nippostrongylus brasiliensis]
MLIMEFGCEWVILSQLGCCWDVALKRSFEKEVARLRREYYGRENMKVTRNNGYKNILEVEDEQFRGLEDT